MYATTLECTKSKCTLNVIISSFCIIVIILSLFCHHFVVIVIILSSLCHHFVIIVIILKNSAATLNLKIRVTMAALVCFSAATHRLATTRPIATHRLATTRPIAIRETLIFNVNAAAGFAAEFFKMMTKMMTK